MNIDTITAQATPAGRGGIAIVRVSGPLTKTIMQEVLHSNLAPRQATYLPFLDANQEIIDEGVAIFFPNPNSFTGEDVLEFQGHGGPVVVDLLLQCILSLGARLASPGEFSERAFLNGKLDLAQAEAIADLIDASSQQAVKSAMRSLQGEFSKEIHALNEKIIHLRTYVEAAIDFSDEEIDFLGDEKISNAARVILADLSAIQNKAKQGSFLREGITAVIAGQPNVGKSSLLNCLSGKETAIVTDIPGTTRDVLRDHVLIDGMPMHIIDTAGLRESQDIVEQEGIRRAYKEMENADIVLYVLAADADISNTSNASNVNNANTNTNTNAANAHSNANLSATNLENINPSQDVFYQKSNNIIFIRNKIDLTQESPSIQFQNAHTTLNKSNDNANNNVSYIASNHDGNTNDNNSNNNTAIISLSVKSGAGIDLLKNQIKKQVGFQASSEGIYLARRRHLDALARAEKHVQDGLQQLSESRAGELAAEDLRQAHLALCEITGEFTADDLLGRIFSSFCIGK
jgi:tRNA modification GTPase